MGTNELEPTVVRQALSRLLPKSMRSDAVTIPVIRLHGGIFAGGSSLRPSLSLASTAGLIEKAFAFRDAPAVAISVNSPGGSPVQARLIYKRIRDLAAEKNKKVIVFVEDVAASGGYMIAVAGDEIVADPSSIVGSIGVVSASFGFQELIKKIGVERRVHTAGQNKAVLDPVFVAGDQVRAAHSEPRRQPFAELSGLFYGDTIVPTFIGQQPDVAPQRHAIGAPETTQCPAWQRFPRIPLALAIVQQAVAGERIAEPSEQHAGAFTLVPAQRLGIPLGTLHVVDRDEGRLTTHREAYIEGPQLPVDLATQAADRLPLLLGVGLGDARILMDAGDLVQIVETDLAFVGKPGDRRRTDRVGRARQRDMPFAGKQSRGRIETEPAGTGDVDLGPGMQVGEVLLRTRRAIECLHIRGQLHQIA